MVDALITASLFVIVGAFVLALLAVLTYLTKRNHALWLANTSTGFSLVSIALMAVAVILNAFGA